MWTGQRRELFERGRTDYAGDVEGDVALVIDSECAGGSVEWWQVGDQLQLGGVLK